MECKHYNRELVEKDRHYVNAPEYNNCVICLVNDKGPMTQEQISEYLGISKMRVSQVQKEAQKKITKKLRLLYFS